MFLLHFALDNEQWGEIVAAESYAVELGGTLVFRWKTDDRRRIYITEKKDRMMIKLIEIHLDVIIEPKEYASILQSNNQT